MRPILHIGVAVAAWVLLNARPAEAGAQNEPPVISHAPVKLAVHGQGISVRAVVTDDTAQVKTVTLFYSASRDAAPIRVPMRNAGAVVYTAAIPSELFAGLSRLYYYIEARDEDDAASETPWYNVEIRSLEPHPETPSAVTPAAVTPPPNDAGKTSWVKPTLYTAAGLLLVGGGVWALTRNGGGGDSGTVTNTPPPTDTNGTGVVTNQYAGTYRGSSTTCFTPPFSAQQCDNRAMTIAITADGKAGTDDPFHAGTRMESALSGRDFVWISTVAETNLNGEVQYEGRVEGTRITGRILGSARTPVGTGVYDGFFEALKQ